MTHQQQPPLTNVCGQACIAIITDMPLPAAIELCTGTRWRRTSEHDLRRALAQIGVALAAFTRWHGRTAWPPVAGIALLRVRFAGWRAGYHWIAAHDAVAFDPSFSQPVTACAYERYLRRRRAYITSWAQVSPA